MLYRCYSGIYLCCHRSIVATARNQVYTESKWQLANFWKHLLDRLRVEQGISFMRWDVGTMPTIEKWIIKNRVPPIKIGRKTEKSLMWYPTALRTSPDGWRWLSSSEPTLKPFHSSHVSYRYVHNLPAAHNSHYQIPPDHGRIHCNHTHTSL